VQDELTDANDDAHNAGRTGSAAGALSAGESVTLEATARLRRFDKSWKDLDKEIQKTTPQWKDLDVGTFCVVEGGKGGSRWSFAPPASNKPIAQGWLDEVAKVEEAPVKPGGKPGGLTLKTKAVVAGQVSLHMFLLTSRTLPEQGKALAAIKKAIK